MTKWGGLPHWEFRSIPLGSDEHGDWYGTPVGTVFSRPGRRHRTETEHVVLVPVPGLLDSGDGAAGWVATFYDAHPSIHTYVDITTPALTTPGLVTCVDLDLDVVRDHDGDRVWVDDEDEFDEHQVALGYPPEVIDGARTACEAVRSAVERREEPFGRASRAWLARLARLTAN